MTTSQIHQIIVENSLIKKAYDFARAAHKSQKRQNGEPYFNHALSVAETLLSWNLDPETIAAGFLHDIPEKCGAKYLNEIKKEFGETTKELVTGVVDIGEIPYRGVENKVDNLRKFIVYISKDIRSILIKFASRLDTLQSLYAYPKNLQEHIARKTMDIYAPLARQLGMYRTAGDLEDLTFPYLYPEDHKWIIENLKETFEEREQYLKGFIPILKDKLLDKDIEIESLYSRGKHHFSLHKKLLRYDMDLDKIYDLVAVRLILKNVSDCYTSLGIIHKTWPPVPGRIKDYIASPKPNGYQSLHTSVYSPENRVTEIQIRTEKMHREAEFGIAAHFAYQNVKGTKKYIDRIAVSPKIKEIKFVKSLHQFPKKLSDIEFFKNTILVLSPKGDVFDLAAGSTPVDFAYKIHSDIGNSCVGVKINGKLESLDTELQSGDVIEILKQKNKKASESWLEFVKNPQTREKIKSSLKQSKYRAIFTKKVIETEIKLSTKDKPSLIKEINNMLTKYKIKIKNLSINYDKKGKGQIIKINCAPISKTNLKEISKELKSLKEVKKISFRQIK